MPEDLQSIVDMLKYFRDQHKKENLSLIEAGDGKYCSDFDYISVRDIQQYVLERINIPSELLG
jgi:hypothetical protein